MTNKYSRNTHTRFIALDSVEFGNVMKVTENACGFSSFSSDTIAVRLGIAMIVAMEAQKIN